MQPPRKYRLLQFGLRSLLIFAFLIGVWLAYHAWRHNAEKSAATKIENGGRIVSVYWRSPFWINWATPYIGDTIFARVDSITFDDDIITDQELLRLPWREFQSLKVVTLMCPSVSEQADQQLSLIKHDIIIERIVLEDLLEELEMIPSPTPRY